jgi:putative ABC transport system permease protein
MLPREALSFSIDALRANRVRTLLTALGLVIGNASVILVVTISLTSRDYILEQIQGIGSNMVYAYYEVGSKESAGQVTADYVKWADVEAVRRQLAGRISAATGVMSSYDRMVIGGKEQDVLVIGSDEQYRQVRNLQITSGRFLDSSDVALRQKVALLTDKLGVAAGRDRRAGESARTAIHGDRHVPRAGTELRSLGAEGRNHPDSDHGNDVLHPGRADRSDVRASDPVRGCRAGNA